MDKYQILHREIEGIPPVDGVTPMNIARLPEPFALLLRTIMRQGSMTVEQLADQLELTMEQAQNLGDHFVAKGYLRIETEGPDEGQVYRVYFARTRKRYIPPELLG
jgi:predicted ArsR family transcriptional regulator